MIGVLSVLEGEHYRYTKRLWQLFAKKYNSVGVQSFAHPNISFQGAQNGDVGKVGSALRALLPELLPIEIQIDGVAHFGEQVIYLKVRKTDQLVKVNTLINDVLCETCSDVLELYTPSRWTPHVTLAMHDLTEGNFRRAWDELSVQAIQFTQQLHNLCTIKSLPNAKYRVVHRYQCE